MKRCEGHIIFGDLPSMSQSIIFDGKLLQKAVESLFEFEGKKSGKYDKMRLFDDAQPIIIQVINHSTDLLVICCNFMIFRFNCIKVLRRISIVQ
jgi:hypothetical protein